MKTDKEIQENSSTILLSQEKGDIHKLNVHAEKVAFVMAYLPFLALSFSPPKKQVESNPALDGFVRMKNSTLNRKWSIWGQTKREKVKVKIFTF